MNQNTFFKNLISNLFQTPGASLNMPSPISYMYIVALKSVRWCFLAKLRAVSQSGVISCCRVTSGLRLRQHLLVLHPVLMCKVKNALEANRPRVIQPSTDHQILELGEECVKIFKNKLAVPHILYMYIACAKKLFSQKDR